MHPTVQAQRSSVAVSDALEAANILAERFDVDPPEVSQYGRDTGVRSLHMQEGITDFLKRLVAATEKQGVKSGDQPAARAGAGRGGGRGGRGD